MLVEEVKGKLDSKHFKQPKFKVKFPTSRKGLHKYCKPNFPSGFASHFPHFWEIFRISVQSMDLQRLHGAVEAAHDSLPEKAGGTWMARPVVTLVMVRIGGIFPGQTFQVNHS